MNQPNISPTKSAIVFLVVLIAASFLTTPVYPQTLPPNFTQNPRLPHPFSLSAEQWDALFTAETPSGKRLSAGQISPLVLHAEWPLKGIPVLAHWHLK